MDTEVQETVLTVVRDVLGRADVGLDDDFFEAGGSSLLVVEAIGRLRELGVAVPARVFVESTRLLDVAEAARPTA
ncbi:MULTISPECIES: phosphopantetheine-binding protein [unclassified Aeromicrobium]|uniref:phosphopantetheine-binding protein n=1 Tax=unclassified Aeromicrobium TaxID=2633570 RepID=UPI0020985C2C|nr:MULTISPECIES: phosphopantetheine-binding protein [unclassified Aeromicrobium]MCO7238570.1 phosphopantetheine-binding protein [Aeromicrobium sp. CnD17-E]MDR6117813.1 hypothetical protein [Aeromicrobium sp. SORGH_AS_0981]